MKDRPIQYFLCERSSRDAIADWVKAAADTSGGLLLGEELWAVSCVLRELGSAADRDDSFLNRRSSV